MSMDDLDRDELERISALLDEESEDGEAVRAALERNPALAARYRAYARLSHGLRELPAPPVSHAFSTRVMGHVRDVTPAPAISWRTWVSVAAAAAVLIVAGVVYWQGASPSRTPDGSWALSVDPGPVESALAERLEGPVNESDLEWEPPLQLEYEAAASPADVDAALLNNVEAVLDANSDLEAVLGSLSEDEAAAFREMLLAYAAEG